LIIVYVGAGAVLFLFVVMMLEFDFAELKGELARLMPLGLAIGGVMLLQLGMAFGNWAQADGAQALRVAPMIDGVDNTTAIGLLVYDQYLYLFQASGLILLVAMIGAILLTLRHRKDVKRQNVLSQMYRKPEDQMKLVDVKPGQGL
jgi:NADH-quinone oxidoreductase subunit J